MDIINDFLFSTVKYFSNTGRFVVNLRPEELLLPSNRLFLLLIGTVGWTLFYCIIHQLPINHHRGSKATLDTKNRIVSIVHASVLFLLSVFDYYYHHRDNCGSPNTEFQNDILMFSTSYFIYDILISIYFKILDSGMLYHHLFVIFSMYSGMLFNNSAEEMIRAMISAEVSNPIMHIRKILSNSGMKETKLHLFLEYIYFVLYIGSRMIFGTMIAYFTVFCMSNLLIVKIGGSGVFVQSILYSKNMLKILEDRKRERLERKSKGVELFWFSFNEKIKECAYYQKAKGEKYVP